MLTQDEQDIVATVRAFVDRNVRPVVRDMEHANEYPEVRSTAATGTQPSTTSSGTSATPR